MIWVRKGSVGREVVDVQTKLLRLGYELGRTGVDGVFGPETERAVRLFQKMRGQEVDGIVGPDTWREMVDASFELGDRQLYLREPPHRGDDVRELQATLNNLGFNAGRVNGVFGEQTDLAIREFQKNIGLDADGIVGETTVEALDASKKRVSSGGITGVWDRAAMKGAGALQERRIAIDNALDLFSRQTAAALATLLEDEKAKPISLAVNTPAADAKERAAAANDAEADILISFDLNTSDEPGRHGAMCIYFDNGEYFSARSRQLAGLIQDEITAALKLLDNGIEGKNLTILRASKMPAVLVKPGFASEPKDTAILETPGAPDKAAGAVIRAMRRYWQE